MSAEPVQSSPAASDQTPSLDPPSPVAKAPLGLLPVAPSLTLLLAAFVAESDFWDYIESLTGGTILGPPKGHH